jgi:hypothetical protein
MNEQDIELVKELGLDKLDETQQAQQLDIFYNTLNTNILMVLEDTLSDEQFAEFERLNDGGDNNAVVSWFSSTVPNYQQIVSDQTEALKQRIKERAGRYREQVNKALK